MVHLVHQEEPVQKNDLFPNQTSLWSICTRLWITGNNVVNNAQFLAQSDPFNSYILYISSGSVNLVFLVPAFFFYFQVPEAADSHFMNHQGSRFQLEIFLTYICDGLRVSKWTAHFHFWANYPFNSECVFLKLKCYQTELRESDLT